MKAILTWEARCLETMKAPGNKCTEGSCVSPANRKAKKPESGKGDSPRNLSNKFRSNYESINWKKIVK